MEGAGTTLSTSRSLRVLVADDEPVIRASVGKVLRMRGHEVREAGSADEACEDPGSALDVVVVDWKMPGTGKAVVERYLDDPSFMGRIILLTGTVEEGTTPFRNRGVVQVRKPFSYPGLVALIEEGPDATPPSLD